MKLNNKKSLVFRCSVEVGHWRSLKNFSTYETLLLKGGEVSPTQKNPLENFNIYKKELVRVFEDCIKRLESEFPKFKVP